MQRSGVRGQRSGDSRRVLFTGDRAAAAKRPFLAMVETTLLTITHIRKMLRRRK